MKLEEIREIMLEIADILNKFPECLQEKAFDVMVHQLFSIEPTAEVLETEAIEEEVITETAVEESVKEKDKKTRKKNNARDTYQINKDLNLFSKG